MKTKNIMSLLFVIIINAVVAAPSYCKIAPETIVAYWLLDDGQGKTATDSSDNAYDGFITGSNWVDGKYGKALEFDGKTDQVEVPDQKVLMAFRR